MGEYLIPANTKRGKLILGYFMPIDLIIFGSCILFSLILALILPIDKTSMAILTITPGVIGGLLVAPVAYYHNVRQLIVEIYKYFFVYRNKYEWKGWCLYDDEGSSKQQ